MKKLLLVLILSFLVLINVRLWGVQGNYSVEQAQLVRSKENLARAAVYKKHKEARMRFGRKREKKQWKVDVHTRKEKQMMKVRERKEKQKKAMRERKERRRVTAQKRKDKREKAIQARKKKKMKVFQENEKNSTERVRSTELPNVDVQMNDYLSEYETVYQMLNSSLVEFTKCSSCSELTLQQLLDLMSSELNLIEVLIYPVTGNRHHLIQLRSELLDQAIPSVRLVYDKILSVVTHNDFLNDQFNAQGDNGCDVRFLLNFNNKKIFLHTMYQRLFDLKQKMQKVQYKFALNQAIHCT